MRQILQTRRVFVIIFGLGLFAMACRNVTDPDVWWHLRTGELILQTHHIPRTDPYSFTKSGTPWIDHEWLSQILLIGVLKIAGWAGLILGFGAVFAAALWLTFLRAPGKPYLAAIVTLLGAFAAAPSWGVRPQMLTFLLASLVLLILEHSYQRTSVLWWIPFLVWLWANLHAGYAIGIGLIALFMIGDAIEILSGFSQSVELRPHIKRLAIIGLISVAAVIANPYGTQLYTYPLETLHSPSMQAYIAEWFSPDFHDPKHLPFLIMILGTLVLPAVSKHRLRPRDVLLLIVMTYAGLRSVRHIPIYVLIAVPLLSAWLEGSISEYWILSASVGETNSRTAKAVLNACVLALFGLFVVIRLATVVKNQPQVEAQNYPANAMEFIRTRSLPRPVLNHYNWGGYMIWKLYPQYRGFIDGRADVYGDEFMDQFASVYYVKGANWQDPLRQWEIQTVLLPPDAPLINTLQGILGWTRVYADNQAVILTRKP